MGDSGWQYVSRKHHSNFSSKEDQAMKISHSVFVTNFPEHFSSQNLWKVCSAYGKVIDVYIPQKKSKAKKNFGFVRFINVFNLERLIGNLCTIWIGHFHLHANPVRFYRDPKIPSASQSLGMDRPAFNFFASVLKSAPPNTKAALDPSHAIVLDESCFMDKDLSGTLMGKIKDINALPNLYDLLEKEGFEMVNLSYLGGFWVLIDTGSSKSKENMIKHMGVLSWFSELVPADDSFVSDERLVWIYVEGLPSKVWSKNAFSKIISPWGSLSDVDEADDPSLPYKKLCVITKPDVSIDYKLKVIVKGRVYWVRIKELDLWSPKFSNYLSDSDSDKDTSVDENLNHDCGNIDLNGDNVNDLDPDHVSKSSFVKKTASCGTKSDDPLFPPGFTPVVESINHVGSKEDNIDQPSCESKSNKEGQSYIKSGNNRILNFKTGGSILDVTESVVEIGQTMGYNMEVCLKNIESIIGDQGDFQFLK
ncbi:RNA-directed DNA polymerase, eukaryota, nucleotide-binding alpha-beta plait domain protein [Tanacetum coccineum]